MTKFFKVKKESSVLYRINFLGIKFKLINILVLLKLNKNINKNISNYKYVHIMHNDKFNKPFVNFLNKYFNKKEHMVLCKQLLPNKPPTEFPVGENVYEFYNLGDLDLDNNNIKKIIFHSLRPEIVDYLYKNKKILDKSYWVIWGGDLYGAPRDKKNDFVRKNINGCCGVMDREVALAQYGMKDNFYNVHYPFSTLLSLTSNIEPKAQRPIYIQINHSCDETTLEMLDVLSKFKNEDIRVRTVLSYGHTDFKQAIIDKGMAIFGEKFEYLDKMLSPEDYKAYVAQNSILILNHDRQQGVGNIVLNIQFGNKVFIKSDVSVYRYLTDIEHVHVFDTYTIPEISFEEFIKNDYQEQNRQNIKEHTDTNYLAELWRNFFDGE